MGDKEIKPKLSRAVTQDDQMRTQHDLCPSPAFLPPFFPLSVILNSPGPWRTGHPNCSTPISLVPAAPSVRGLISQLWVLCPGLPPAGICPETPRFVQWLKSVSPGLVSLFVGSWVPPDGLFDPSHKPQFTSTANILCLTLEKYWN